MTSIQTLRGQGIVMATAPYDGGYVQGRCGWCGPGLHQAIIDKALNVYAPTSAGHSTGRALIDGAVIIYNLDEPPAWLVPILAARDEDGHIAA